MGCGCTKGRGDKYELLSTHPLVLAAEEEDVLAVRKLVATRKKEELQDPISKALFDAINRDRVDMIRLLLESGYQWNPVNTRTGQPGPDKNRTMTLKGNHPAGPEYLAEVSVATNVTGPFGETVADDGTFPERAPCDNIDPPRITNGPLQYAIRWGSLNSVQALANTVWLTAEPKSIALVAQRSMDKKNPEEESIQCARVLIGASTEHWPWQGSVSMVHHALYANREQLARFFVVLGDDINRKNEAGLTPLQEHAGTGNIKAVRFLLSMGADVNIQADDPAPLYRFGQMMAMHFAAKSTKSAHREILQALIAASGNVNAQAWEKFETYDKEESNRKRGRQGMGGYSTYSKVIHVKSDSPRSLRRIVRPSDYYPALWLLWEEHKKLCGA